MYPTMRNPCLQAHLAVFIVVALATLDGGDAIDCFKCVSIGGDFPACDDPFHNNFTNAILESPCMGGRKGRNGLFPATACIKLAGKYVSNGQRITVRGCELDSGGITVDTEIIRMSHCGAFYFDENYVRGCLQSCDTEACNDTSRPRATTSTTLLSVLVAAGVAARLTCDSWR